VGGGLVEKSKKECASKADRWVRISEKDYDGMGAGGGGGPEKSNWPSYLLYAREWAFESNKVYNRYAKPS